MNLLSSLKIKKQGINGYAICNKFTQNNICTGRTCLSEMIVSLISEESYCIDPYRFIFQYMIDILGNPQPIASSQTISLPISCSKSCISRELLPEIDMRDISISTPIPAGKKPQLTIFLHSLYPSLYKIMLYQEISPHFLPIYHNLARTHSEFFCWEMFSICSIHLPSLLYSRSEETRNPKL